MDVRRWSLYAAVTPACVFSFLGFSESFGQNGVTPDRVAGRAVDSLFEPIAPESLVPTRGSQPVPRRGIKRPTLQAKLVRNSNTKDGAPPYALVDRYGGILRYVEPVDKVKLEPYVGRIVKVRHDTGDTLLASQLIFPPLTRKASTSSPVRSGVQQAAFQEPIPAGEPAGDTLLEPTPADEPEPALEGETYTFDEGDEVYMGEGAPVYEEGVGFGDCPDCVDGTCSLHVGHGYRAAVRQEGMGSRAYARGEYLLWWFNGMNTPPLVTESSDLSQRAAIISNPGVDPEDHPATEVIYGGEPILEDPQSGFRVMLGVWLDENNKQAIEGDYLFLGKVEETFSAGGVNNSRVISRPYFELVPTAPDDDDTDTDDEFIPPREAAQAVSNDLLDGTVTVISEREFQGAGIRLRHNLCRSGRANIGCGNCVDCGVGVDCGLGVDCGYGVGCGSLVGGGQFRYVDLVTGVRWYQLEESLNIFEDLEVSTAGSVNIPPDVAQQEGAMIFVEDSFRTSNEFIGGELGFDWGVEWNRYSVGLLSKLAIGNTRQNVTIFGETNAIDGSGVQREPQSGGLLALDSNIGSYEHDSFSVIPEINLNLGYKLTQRCKLLVGYTLLYWTDVVRPGDQIDRELNTTQQPTFGLDTTPIIPPLRPQFVLNETNVLIQGLNIGAVYCW